MISCFGGKAKSVISQNKPKLKSRKRVWTVVSYVCYTCYYDMIHMTHNMLSRIYLKDHSSFCLSSVHWAISSAIRNSLKSRKLFPSESNIRKMWSQKLSALPEGKIFVNSSEDWKQLTFFQSLLKKHVFTVQMSSWKFAIWTLSSKTFEPKQNGKRSGQS